MLGSPPEGSAGQVHPERSLLEQMERPGAKRYLVRWWGQFGFIDTTSNTNRLPRGRRAGAILALAASRPGVPILRSDLAAMFWGDRGDEQARASVRQSLAELRSLANGDEPALAIDQGSIALLPDRVETRADQIAQLRAGDVEQLQALLDSGDTALAGLDGISPAFDEWLRSERALATEALIDASIGAAMVAVANGNASGAQRLVNRVQVIDPLDERVARAGFDADSAVSDSAALERRMRGLEKRLKDDLDVEPSPATVEAYKAASARMKSGTARAAPGGDHGQSILSGWSKGQKIAAAIVAALLFAAVLALLSRNTDPRLAGTQAIAVVPFTSAEDQRELAEGLTEEIVSRLSRNPRIAPLGRNSARVIGDDPSSAIALGRELRVAYLLTGSVDNRNERVRVAARLIRTRDGEPMWNAEFTGTTAQLIPLIDRMATDVSRRLGAGDLAQPTSRGPRNGAGQLYLRARSLLRGVEPHNVSTAVELLRQAARLDPDYAPVWSLLGMATRIEQLQHLTPVGDPNTVLIPQAYARRGLELAPNSALANLAMGDTLAEDPRSLPYVLRAAELDPTNAEIWHELSEKYQKAGDFVRFKDAVERAAKIDPLWPALVVPAATFNWEIGDRQAAKQLVGQLYRHGQPQAHIRHMLRGHFAFQSGDFSRAMEEFTAAGRSVDAASRVWADGGRAAVYQALGMFDEARRLVPYKTLEQDFDLYAKGILDPSVIEISRKHPFYAWNVMERNYHLLRLLVNRRRFADVAALYDRRFKSPEEFLRTPRGHIAFVNDSIPVVLALREVGRRREADRLYAIVRNEVAKRHRASKVPDWYDVMSAQVYAIGGDDRAALAALERAIRNGWLNRTNLATRDIAHEPAFQSLADAPRFQAIRNRLESLYAKERREIEAMTPGA